MNRLRKAAATVVLAAMLLNLLTAAAVHAENDTYDPAADKIRITTVGDWQQLALDCKLDSFSAGKTVVLVNDLDLSRVDNPVIPAFSGTFEGNGHSLTGVRLKPKSGMRGLFRTILPGAEVKNLTVEGEVLSEKDKPQDRLGILCGKNNGTVIDVTVRGKVQGQSRLGGIAGENTEEGQISACRSEAAVDGRHYLGGIAGFNSGSITLCESVGSIGTAGETKDRNRWREAGKAVNDMENSSKYTDMGGIAGYSEGVLLRCAFSGTAGHAHLSENAGGIAGRSAGRIIDCESSGSIAGRADIGGICGQLEPETVLFFSPDMLTRMAEAMEALCDRPDLTAEDARYHSGRMNKTLEKLIGDARTAKEAVDSLADALVAWSDGTVDQANELSARLSWMLDAAQPVMDDAASLATDARLLKQAADVAGDLLRDAGDDAHSAVVQTQQAADSLEDAVYAMEQTAKDVQRDLDILRQTLGVRGAVLSSAEALRQDLSRLADARSSAKDAAETMRSALNGIRSAADLGQEAVDALDAVDARAGVILNRLQSMADRMSAITAYLSALPDVVLDKPGPATQASRDDFSAAMDTLLDDSVLLTGVLEDASDDLLDDFDAINVQLRIIADIMKNQRDIWQEGETIEDHLIDVSAEEGAADAPYARISGCSNSGAVSEDENGGGIAGCSNIETDFDPSQDLPRANPSSLNMDVQARAYVLSSINSGAVAVRDKAAGGIIGNLRIGLCADCESYGNVSVSNGDSCGGIAGTARGSILRGWTRARLSAENRVGGIAGTARRVADCTALAEINSEGGCLGAILGEIDPNADQEDIAVSGNRFCGGELGGIDDISYAGKAVPVPFETLSGADTPPGFARLTLTFKADGKIIAERPFVYGGAVDPLPDIPQKDGFYAVWPDLDYKHLTVSRTVEAVYRPYSTSLAEDNGSAAAETSADEVVAGGTFSGKAALVRTKEDVSFSDERGRTHSGSAETVTVIDPLLDNIHFTVHRRLPDVEKKYRVWVRSDDGSWTRIKVQADGSYLLFDSEDADITYLLEERTGPAHWLPFLS